MDRLPAPPLPGWLDGMLPFTRYRVAVGEGLSMHVMEAGEGLPVLMLHGNPSWGFLYRRVAGALAGEPLRLVMPDLVGLGLSDKPRDPSLHQLDNHQRWMRRLIEELQLEHYVMVVQDWGGPIGVGAVSQLDHAVGLVILNTALTPPRAGFRPTAFHRFARLPGASDVAFRLLGFPQSVLGMTLGRERTLLGDVARAYRYPLRALRDRVAPLAMARMVPDSLDHPSIPALERCRVWIDGFRGPAAIVWGDRDPVLGGGVRSWMEKLFPEAPVTRTHAGHFLQEEVPSEIADAVRYVADRLGARGDAPPDPAGHPHPGRRSLRDL